MIDPAALDLMARRPRTPLQFAEHINRAFEAGLRRFLNGQLEADRTRGLAERMRTVGLTL